MRVRSRLKTFYRVPSIAIRGADNAVLANVSPIGAIVNETMADVNGGPYSKRVKQRFFEKSNRLGLGHLGAQRYNLAKLISASGVPRVNPLEFHSTSERRPSGSFFINRANGQNFVRLQGCIYTLWNTGNIVIPHSTLLPSTPVVDLDLGLRFVKSKILAKVGDPEYSFGEPLAEIASTVKLFTHPLNALVELSIELHRSTKNRTFKKTARVRAQAIASVWAEYRFAISPLVRTIDDGLQALADALYRKDVHQFKKLVESHDMSERTIRFTDNPDSRFTAANMSATRMNVTNEAIRTVKGRARCGLWYYHADQGSIQSLLGLRARDIPRTLWEIFPLSFMFDRMYNLKACLTASSTFLSSKVKLTGGWESTRLQNDLSVRMSSIELVNRSFGVLSPSQTNPDVTTSFSLYRREWKPSISDVAPPARAKRLVDTITHQLDLAAIITGKISSAMRS